MIHEIKKLRPPPLDTAFAQRVGHETVEDLRAALRSELLEMMAQRGRDREVRDLIEVLIERNPFDVPRPMVTDRAQTLVASISAQLVDGMSQAMGMTLDDLEEEKREHVLEEAEFSVRRELILEAIGREEGIRLEDGECDAGIEEMAARTGQPADGLRSALLRGGMGKYEAKLLEDKIIAWLLERAELVTEGAPS
jgi:trigger factor